MMTTLFRVAADKAGQLARTFVAVQGAGLVPSASGVLAWRPAGVAAVF